MVVMLETNCVLLSAWLFVFVAGGFVFIFSVGAVETDLATSNHRIRSLHLPSETTF